MNGAVLVHGGTMGRRTALAAALRAADGLTVRVRLSSRAAEAAKCLADPAIVAVFLVDAPDEAVRAAATARGLASTVYELQPRDTADVAVTLARAAEIRHRERSDRAR